MEQIYCFGTAFILISITYTLLLQLFIMYHSYNMECSVYIYSSYKLILHYQNVQWLSERIKHVYIS